jgi:hypothetical protein
MGATATPANRPATPAELLNAAADRIQTYGWIRNSMYADTDTAPFESACCADGALWLSAGFDPYDAHKGCYNAPGAELVVEAETVLAERLGNDRDASYARGLIFCWNDGAETDSAEVVAKLREAATASVHHYLNPALADTVRCAGCGEEDVPDQFFEVTGEDGTVWYCTVECLDDAGWAAE